MIFFNKTERKTLSESFRKRPIVLHGNKLDLRIHEDKSAIKYAIK